MNNLKHLLFILVLLILTGCCFPAGNPFSSPNNDDKSSNEQISPIEMMKKQQEYQKLLIKFDQAQDDPNITEEELNEMKDELAQKEEELKEAQEKLRNSNDPMIKEMFQKMDEAYKGAEDAQKNQEEEIRQLENHSGVGLNEEEIENAMEKFSGKSNNEELQPYNEAKDSSFDINDNSF